MWTYILLHAIESMLDMLYENLRLVSVALRLFGTSLLDDTAIEVALCICKVLVFLGDVFGVLLEILPELHPVTFG